MRDTRVKAVLFDLGETILSFGRVSPAELFREGAKLSYSFLKSLGQPIDDFKPYCRRNLSAIRMQYWLAFLKRKDFNALDLLKKVNAKRDIKITKEQWQQLIWLWYEPLSKFAKIESNIKQTLNSLKGKSLKLGILSNTFINDFALERHLSEFGLLEFFDIRLYSYQFEWRKPDTRIFRAAAEKIGEKPNAIMFVGDRINKDIRPALKVGMTAVMKTAYTNGGKKLPKGAYKIRYLNELPTLIEKINTEKKY